MLPKQRTIFETSSFILSALYIVPIALFFERWLYPGSPVFLYTAIAMLSVLGYLAGRFTLYNAEGLAAVFCVVPAVLSGAVVLIVLPNPALYKILFTFMTVGMSLYYFFMARKAGFSVFGPFVSTGILIYLFSIVIMTTAIKDQAALKVMNSCAIVYFLLSLYSFNLKGLRKSLFKGDNVKNVRYPSGMRRNNLFIITVFIILAVLISNIHPFFEFFWRFAGIIAQAIIMLFKMINRLFATRNSGSTTVEDDSPVEKGESIFDTTVKTESPFVTATVNLIVFAAIAAIAVYFIWASRKHIARWLNNLPGILGKLKNMFAAPTLEDYVDETEDLFDWKDFSKSAGDKLRQVIKKITTRPQKIDDMPDDRMRVRFAYKELLRKNIAQHPNATFETPYEFELHTKTPIPEEFVDSYITARYSSGDITKKDGELARQVVKKYI